MQTKDRMEDWLLKFMVQSNKKESVASVSNAIEEKVEIWAPIV